MDFKRDLLYPLADVAFSAYGSAVSHNYDAQRTIAIASSPRGGSTWLAEIIGGLPGRPIIWEPLHPGNNPVCTEHGFGWQNYMNPNQEDAGKVTYLNKLFAGKDISTRTLTSLQLRASSMFPFRGLIVKFVNANMLLPWMAGRIPIRTVLMIRHPCAVVESQMRNGAWRHLTDKSILTVPSALIQDRPHLANLFERISTPAELLAFEYALQLVVPLSADRQTWLLTTYEKLLIERETEVERIFAYLGEPVPDAAFEALDKPSATTSNASVILSNDSPLEGWAKRLTSDDVNRILSVMNEAGVDVYGRSGEPDYSALRLEPNMDWREVSSKHTA